MKFSYINFYFLVSLIVSVTIRVLQLVFTIDPTTGFVKEQYSSVSFAITGVVIAAAAIAVLFSLFYAGSADSKRNDGFFTGVAAIILSLGICTEMVGRIAEENAKGNLGLSVFDIFSLSAAVFFAVYGLSVFFKFRLHGIYYAIPIVYFTGKLVCMFINVAYLALITDNIFLIAGACFTLMFMLELGKKKNGYDKSKVNKKLLASALGTVFFNTVTVLPQLIGGLFKADISFKESASDAVLMLSVALFAGVYMVSCFKKSSVIDKTA